MSKPGGGSVVSDIRVLFESGTAVGLSDGQLLDRFIEGREEVVFEALTRRHGAMVWGVCRRLLRDHHDAEDAFQATFLVLARKAASVVPRHKLANWLHGVAYQTALKARSIRSKRRAREVQVEGLAETVAAPRMIVDERLSDLDRELRRLPEKYRIPLILCELQGKTHREAGEELGWPIGTVSGRLSRARELLGRRLASSSGGMAPILGLARDGIVPSAHLIGPSAHAAVAILANPTVKAGVVSAEVLALMDEVLKTMLQLKIKAFAAVSLVGLAVCAGGTSLAYRVEAPPAPIEPVEPQAPQAKGKEQAADPMASYAYKIDPDAVYEYTELAVDQGDLRLKTGPVLVLPMTTERGIAGAMLIGNGTFRYTPEKEVVIEGQSRSLMLRFNPEDQAAILPLQKGKKISDRGTAEMAQYLLRAVVPHCWHRGPDLLIPSKGAFAAVLFTREHGDLLISFDAKTATVFNFTDRKRHYQRK